MRLLETGRTCIIEELASSILVSTECCSDSELPISSGVLGNEPGNTETVVDAQKQGGGSR